MKHLTRRAFHLLCSIGIVIISTPISQSFGASEHLARVKGTIKFIENSVIANAKIVIQGSKGTYETFSREDGTYEINVPAGEYRMKAWNSGMCIVRRAPFRIQPSTVTTFDFTLVSCPKMDFLVHDKNGQCRGEKCDEVYPFRDDTFHVSGKSNSPLEILIRFGEKHENHGVYEYDGSVIKWRGSSEDYKEVERKQYLGVMVSYNLMTIYADKVLFNKKDLELKAEGNLVVENGERRIQARYVEVRFKGKEPAINIIR